MLENLLKTIGLKKDKVELFNLDVFIIGSLDVEKIAGAISMYSYEDQKQIYGSLITYCESTLKKNLNKSEKKITGSTKKHSLGIQSVDSYMAMVDRAIKLREDLNKEYLFVAKNAGLENLGYKTEMRLPKTPKEKTTEPKTNNSCRTYFHENTFLDMELKNYFNSLSYSVLDNS